MHVKSALLIFSFVVVITLATAAGLFLIVALVIIKLASKLCINFVVISDQNQEQMKDNNLMQPKSQQSLTGMSELKYLTYY